MYSDIPSLSLLVVMHPKLFGMLSKLKCLKALPSTWIISLNESDRLNFNLVISVWYLFVYILRSLAKSSLLIVRGIFCELCIGISFGFPESRQVWESLELNSVWIESQSNFVGATYNIYFCIFCDIVCCAPRDCHSLGRLPWHCQS